MDCTRNTRGSQGGLPTRLDYPRLSEKKEKTPPRSPPSFRGTGVEGRHRRLVRVKEGEAGGTYRVRRSSQREVTGPSSTPRHEGTEISTTRQLAHF